MLRKHTLLLLITAWALQGSWTAPAGRTITGIVTAADETGPVEGVQVSVKGTKVISGTQPDGVYYIPVTDKDSVLLFSHCDFQTQEVKLTAANEYNILLQKKKAP